MNEKILVVDDDPMVAEYLAAELKRHFCDAICVGTGAEALARLNEVQIVFLDLKLPDMDGFEILTKIKERSDSKRPIEAIVITGFGNQEVAIRALRLGAIDYIAKPIYLDDLRAALGRAQEVVSQKMKLKTSPSILVIDDEVEIADTMRGILEKEGYNAYSCNSGRAGIELIAKQKIDVVLTDINMAEINGLEVLKQAKLLFPDIEVIMTTGHGGYELAVQCLRAGALDYLLKPINLEQLLWAVEKATEKIRLFRSSLYRTRELKLSSEIMNKMNEEQEKIITERTAKLNQTQATLIQTSKLATLGEMSAGMAHELNQPLGGISLVSQTMKKLKARNLLTDEEIDRSIKDIDTCVKRMTKIIQHVRTFARQENLKFSEVNVNETVDSAVMLLGEQLRLHGVELKTEFTPALVKVLGEPYQLEQVWINLISNARDALEEREAKGAEKEVGYTKQLLLRTRVEGDELFVECTDNGIGMTQEQVAKVFEPFYTTKPVGKGMGLGMSITYGILESHKGTIEIRSEKGKGTTMLIKLKILNSTGHAGGQETGEKTV